MPRNEGRDMSRAGQRRPCPRGTRSSLPATALNGLWAHCCSIFCILKKSRRSMSNPLIFKAIMWGQLKLVSRSPIFDPQCFGTFSKCGLVLVLPFL